MSQILKRVLIVTDEILEMTGGFPTGDDKVDHIRGRGTPVYRPDLGGGTSWYYHQGGDYWIYDAPDASIQLIGRNPNTNSEFIHADDTDAAGLVHCYPTFINLSRPVITGIYIDLDSDENYNNNWSWRIGFYNNSNQLMETFRAFPDHKRGSNNDPYVQTAPDFLMPLGVNRRWRCRVTRRTGTDIDEIRDALMTVHHNLGFPAS